jgi:HK97 family phage major capsid protein
MRGGKLDAGEFKAPATQTTTWPAGVPILTDYDRTIVQARRERPTIADLCGSGTISGNAISYFVEAAMQGGFATVAEGAAKPQVSFDNPTAVVDALKKIAGWIDMTDEFIEDLGFLKSEIDTRLLYALTMFEESQLLSGNGTGQNLLGIRNRSGVQVQAAPADAADNADAVFQAMTKVSTATSLTADALVIHPLDYQEFRLSKDGNGQYFGGGYFQGQYGNGSVMDNPNLWGLRTVVTTAATQGELLLGAFRVGATVYRKGGVRVEASNSHADNFTTNKVTVRAEERVALAVRYPAAFVKVGLAA